MRASHRSLFFALAISAAAMPTAAHAGGLFLPGIGPIAQARAGANVASVNDPSAIASNPAGLAETPGTVVIIGSRFLDMSLQFKRLGTYDATDNANPWEGERYPQQENVGKPAIGVGGFQVLPMIAASFDLSKQVDGLHVAAGLYVPTSYPTRDFGSDYELPTDTLDETVAPPPTRYDIVKQDAAIIMPSVAVAYEINDKFSVGGRFTWGIANLEATSFAWGQYINRAEWAQRDSVFHVKTKDNFAPAFGLGVQGHLTDQIDVGLNWDSGMSPHTRGIGDAKAGKGLELAGEPVVIVPNPNPSCGEGGEIGALKACIDIALPMVTTIGGRYKILDGNGLEKGDNDLDVAWERWSAASDYKVTVDGVASGLALNPTSLRHNFQDVVSVRLGGGYRLPVGDGLRLNAGIAYDTAAAPDGWERVDLDGAARTTFGLGASYPVTRTIDVNLGGGYVYEGVRQNGTRCNPTDTNVGCSGDNEEHPLDEHQGPDPIQPLNSGTPFESPFNVGTYRSHYIEFSLAAVMRF
jgi:long-subunit fatty acid transport protein